MSANKQASVAFDQWAKELVQAGSSYPLSRIEKIAFVRGFEAASGGQNNDVYLVTEEAVYRHRILGIYNSKGKAEDRASSFAETQDGHHIYCVWHATLNEAMDDPVRVCTFQRDQINTYPSFPRMFSDVRRIEEPVEKTK